MKFIFFGTDDFSVTVLDELKRSGFLPSLIVTTPDKPKGRGLKILPSTAKLWSERNNIPVTELTPDVGGFKHRVSAAAVEIFIVASYGKIIPKAILDIPEKGVLNVHPSLLPKYRGASPIESQILTDEKEIGVTIMLMDEQMDHGPLLAQRKIETKSRKKLAEEGGKLLAETLPKWIAGEIQAVPQDESKASYTKKITKKDGLLDLAGDPYQNFLKICAYESSVGTYFLKDTKRIIIKDAKFENGNLIITRVIPEGKKEMNYEEFLRGLH
ncbi:MAG: methionyl-tRNA formyltransferase [bacterium]|nr:methionyl-tRNA formyltransferase [bacterium]